MYRAREHLTLLHVLTRLAAATLTLASLTTLGGLPAAAAAGNRGEARAVHVKLLITYRPAPDTAASVWTLTCNPVAGTHPAPAAACTRIAALSHPFVPVPADASCTTIYGGAQTATVAGTLNGTTVTATFDRRGGCAIKRWNAHAPIIAPTPR